MNSRERFLAAVGHREPDRVPVKIQLLYDWQQTDESYREFRDYHAQYGDTFDAWYPPQGRWFLDPIAAREEMIVEADGRQCHVLQTPRGELVSCRSPRGPGGRPKRFMSSAEDARKFLSIQEVSLEPDVSGFHEKGEAVGDEGMIWIRLPDPIGVVAGNFDEEPFALLAATDEALIMEMLGRVADREYRYIERLLSQGVRGVYNFSGPEFAIPPLMSPRLFERFVVGFNRRLYDLIHRHGSWVETHCHGKTSGFLEAFAEMGSDLVNPLEPPPIGDVVLSDAKRRVGDRLCLVGNMQLDEIERGSPERVRHLTAEAIKQAGAGGGFIFSLCAALYRRNLPDQCTENLKVILDTIHTVGRYPISPE